MILSGITDILLFQTSGRRNSIFNILYSCVYFLGEKLEGHGPGYEICVRCSKSVSVIFYNKLFTSL